MNGYAKSLCAGVLFVATSAMPAAAEMTISSQKLDSAINGSGFAHTVNELGHALWAGGGAIHFFNGVSNATLPGVSVVQGEVHLAAAADIGRLPLGRG